MPNRTCAATLQPMDSLPVPATPPLRCPTCGYDLHAADLVAPCPECGTPAADAHRPNLVNHATRASLMANLAGAMVLALPAAFAIVYNVVRILTGTRLVRIRSDLYDMIQVMILVVGIFLLTDTGRHPKLVRLRRRGWLVRFTAAFLGISTAYMLYRSRELMLYSGMWNRPIDSVRSLIYHCDVPAVVALGLVLLWRHLWLWAQAARDRRIRPLIAVTLTVALFVPIQAILHALVVFAATQLGGNVELAAAWTSPPYRLQPYVYILSVLLWLNLIARFVYTTRAVILRRTST
ncbi:MAG: hypothetical protein ACREJO_15090 [Phycisphaerales bacterium]